MPFYLNYVQFGLYPPLKWPGGLKKGGGQTFSRKKGGVKLFLLDSWGGVKFFSRVLRRHARRARVTENALYRLSISILMPYKAIEVLYILL